MPDITITAKGVAKLLNEQTNQQDPMTYQQEYYNLLPMN